MKYKLLIILITAIVIPILTANAGQETDPSSQFPEVRIYITNRQFNVLQGSRGTKLTLSKPVLLINKDTAEVKEIHSRGNNSLQFQRKSLSVDLEKSLTINFQGEKVHLKKFNLLNLVMDKNLWRNRWANLHLSSLGLFPLFNTYCKVWINDHPIGIYLLVDKPQHAASKLESPYTLRRGAGHSISDEFFDSSLRHQAVKYRKQFLSIYPILENLQGDNLLKSLDKIIDLDHYFKWIAFNYLVMNGDYADEVFLYINPKNGLFDVIPWDFDDILRPVPHEGREKRNESFVDRKVYSLEELLDRAIATDHILYHHYLRSMKSMVGIIDSTMLVKTTNQVIQELEQVSADPEFAKVSTYLDQTPFDFNRAREDLVAILGFMISRRRVILSDKQIP